MDYKLDYTLDASGYTAEYKASIEITIASQETYLEIAENFKEYEHLLDEWAEENKLGLGEIYYDEGSITFEVEA